MKFYAVNYLRTVFSHPKENMVILFDLIVSTAVVFVLIQNFFFLKEKHDEVFFDDRVAKLYAMNVDDGVFVSIEKDVFNKTSMYDIGLKIYDEINSSEMKIFSTSYTTIPVTSFDDDTKDKFSQIGRSMGMINMYMVSDFALEGLGLNLSDGRWFTKEELDYPNICERVPVILGSKFRDVFNIGDVITSRARDLYDEAIVIGFLDQNSSVEYYNIIEGGFNDAIIVGMNSFFPRNNEKTVWDEATNIERVRAIGEGFLYCPDESIDVQKEINRYTSKYGFYQITAQPIDGSAYSETRSISERNLLLIGVLAVSTTVICMISLGGVLYNRTLDDRRTYCIYMSAGIPLWKINLSLILEMLFWMVLSILPVIALSLYEYQTLMIPLWQIGLFELVVMAVSIAPSLRVNSKCNLDLLIRNQTN